MFPYINTNLHDLSRMMKMIDRPIGIEGKARLSGCKSKYYYKTSKAFTKRNKYKKFKR